MIKIFVLSDTHLRNGNFTIEPDTLKDIEESEFVIHCGDHVCQEAYDYLSTLKQVHGVLGNMDYGEITYSLPEKKTVEIDGVKIGIIHGWGSPVGLAKKVLKEFTNINAVCFGHSHVAYNEKIGDVLLFNPGAFSPRILKGRGSYGILTVASGKISGQIKKR